MARHQLEHLHKQTSRHGKVTWYVRIGKGKRTRIKGEYGSLEFKKAYYQAVSGALPAGGSPETDKKTLAWLIARYRESGDWSSFSAATRRQREAIFRQIIKNSGSYPFAKIKKSHIAEARDKRRETPSQANHVLKTLRALFKWAVGAGHLTIDPAEGVHFIRVKTSGHRPWTPADVDKFEKRWPIGTRERLAMALLAYTGVRRGDVVRLGPNILRDGCFELEAEKNGEAITIVVPPALAEIIEATPVAGETYLQTSYGDARSKNGFGNWFREICDEAGVPGSAHGLRKALAARAAERGATDEELDALFGWRGKKTSAIYTRTARRKLMAKNAMKKVVDGDRPGAPEEPQKGEG